MNERLVQEALELPDDEKAHLCTELLHALFVLPRGFNGHLDMRFRGGHIVHVDGGISFDASPFMKSSKRWNGSIAMKIAAAP